LCGIIGYIGEENAAPILLNGLKKMEYRGYDSAGIATLSDDGILLLKDKGKISEIDQKVNFLDLKGKIGIAHTRWATHGGVTYENAHPHVSCGLEVATIHNGIIENHHQLRKKLMDECHNFNSDTDSEIIAHLLERYYKESGKVKKALLQTVQTLKGTFAFQAIFKHEPNIIVGARKDAPLVIGLGKNGNFLASDIISFIDHTDKVMFLDNHEIVVMRGKRMNVYTFNGERIVKEITQVAWEAKETSKEAFAHYTVKEIHEQPKTLRTAMHQNSKKVLDFICAIKEAEQIYITACGTSYHAGLIFRNLLARIAKVRSHISVSSEFSQNVELIDEDTLVIALSQSGETADVLESVSLAKEQGAKVFSILNAEGSSLSRESQMNLFFNCGPEIGVAATKSFTGQLAVIYVLIFSLVDDSKMSNKLFDIPRNVEKVLETEKNIIKIAEKYKDDSDLYFIGRSIHFPIALEGALKLKELSYNHAEGMAGGELKHGTLALIEEGKPVIVLNPKDHTYDEMLNNISEMKARGAKIIGVSNRPNGMYDDFIQIPKVDELLYPIVEVIPLQLLAYHTAVLRQRNPDYPRNLAKSVTVT
jgi:glucosamine--fructose-6-phosphate aminotransferase (isomerizing)|tara:strand:- start:4418 stop:6187 length:1770 start_codon:yes stop_codon:yes gene_type:complete